jgi:hypothetical protein
MACLSCDVPCSVDGYSTGGCVVERAIAEHREGLESGLGLVAGAWR